jgi:hypothetical protein
VYKYVRMCPATYTLDIYTLCVVSVNIMVLIRRKNQQYALIVPSFIYFYVLAPTCLAVACHHQGAYWILLSYLKNTTEGWYII